MISAIKSRCGQAFSQISETAMRLSAFSARHHMILIWCVAIMYKFALDALYVWVASPSYAYAGLTYQPSFLKYAIASAMYIALFAYLPKDERSVAAVLLHIQFAYTVAPMLTFYALANGSSKYMLMVFICILMEIFIVRRNRGRQNPVYITGVSSYVTVGIGVLIIATLIIPILYNGFNGLKVFDFEYIYEMRANATYPAGFAYLFFWMGKGIIPFSVVLLLDRKKYGWMTVAILIQIMLYMECGNKYLLFILVPVIFVYLCAKSGNLIKLIYAGLCILFLAMIPAYIFDTVGGHALGTRTSFYVSVRAVFHPADNKFAMYECFSQYPKMLFSNGLLGKMFGLTKLYAGSEGQVIYAYNGGEFLSANMNTGYLGEAYAQLGFAGMILMSGLFSGIIRAIEAFNSRKTFCVLTAVFAMYIINLNDIALLTTLMSSGMAVVLVLVAVYLRKGSEELKGGV